MTLSFFTVFLDLLCSLDMRIAIVGGTHGNEPVGVEVIKELRRNKPKGVLNDYEAFIGNPKAYEFQKRFVDYDLNRSFGKNATPFGYEKERAKELRSLIEGKFDLVIDLHTTTTNMGLTAILNNTHSLTRQTCSFLKSKNSKIKLIEENILNDESTHLNRLAPAGVTIELGPVANNVVSGDLVIKMYEIVLNILSWDFKENFDFSKNEIYQTTKEVYYPKKETGWYVHPDLEGSDFKKLSFGNPMFINVNKEVLNYEEEESVYPFFINEAAYQNSGVAMYFAKKRES